MDVFFSAGIAPKPVVIFSHGFKGFKDWGHFNLVAEAFARENFIFVKFNFSHNGTTPEDPLSFGNLEAFGNNNYLIELDDLKLVMDAVEHQRFLKGIADPGRIYLLGHSRGGGISILKAGEDKRVRKLCTWASVSTLVNRNKKKTIETWQRDGVVYAHNSRTGQDMPMYKQFYDVLISNKKRLNVGAAAKRLSIPFLIVHGDADETVPLREAETLHRSAPRSELLVIKKANHPFGGKHPFNSTHLPDAATQAVEQAISFFQR